MKLKRVRNLEINGVERVKMSEHRYRYRGVGLCGLSSPFQGVPKYTDLNV
jgi:hypothetical protein